MRRLLPLAVLLSGCASAPADPPPAADPPNIIFFLSDDQRADFLGCAGHPFVKTPTIDRLAKEGVRFSNAFVTTSICAASRATLLTGLWERTHRFTFGTPPIATAMTEASYPALLRRAGYRTGFVGKFGVKVQKGQTDAMFDKFLPRGRNPYFKKQPDGSKRHLTNLVGDLCVEFLNEGPKDRPFCLSVSFNAAHAEDSDKKDHYPWPPEEDGLYEDARIPDPPVPFDHWKSLPAFFGKSIHRDRWFWRWDTPEKYAKNVRAYFRMITGLDRVMGRVLDEVRRLGLAGNTVVIFMGDNGYYLGSRGFAGKWTHFEESLRVPLVIHDPRVPARLRGRVLPQMALNVDIAATIADAAGVAAPGSWQGRSLLPLARGEAPARWRNDFFCEHLMNHAKIPKWEGVRGSRYVYARYFENLPEGEFLHDLEKDPREERNFAGEASYREVLEEMRRRCDALRDARGGPYVAPPPKKRRNP